MKSILLVCNQAEVDPPLRRSLAHLIKSCHIEIVHDGHRVFKELSQKTFDLIIVDFAIAGIDSLELVESIQYIDPGIPVLLMIPQAHTAIWNTVRQLKAQPISRPFKPLTFLRQIDRLLHQQLDRYRRLAKTLTDILDTLCAKLEAPYAFLVEETGQILIASGEMEGMLPETLADLAITPYAITECSPQISSRDKTLYVYPQVEHAYGLYTTPVTENLRLAVVLTSNLTRDDQIWSQLGQAAQKAHLALQGHAGDEILPAPVEETRQFIPLHLHPETISEDIHAETAPDDLAESPVSEYDEVDEVAINWNIITRDSTLLNRLHEFCQVA